MITEIVLDDYEHPGVDCDFHFMLSVSGNGNADLLAVKHTGSGWVEDGRADQLIASTRALARELDADGRSVVVTYAVPDPDLWRRNGSRLRRVK